MGYGKYLQLPFPILNLMSSIILIVYKIPWTILSCIYQKSNQLNWFSFEFHLYIISNASLLSSSVVWITCVLITQTCQYFLQVKLPQTWTNLVIEKSYKTGTRNSAPYKCTIAKMVHQNTTFQILPNFDEKIYCQ